MNWKYVLTMVIYLISWHGKSQEKQSFKIVTIAFYNLENLFHPSNDPLTYDDDRTPEGKDHWTQTIYEAKLKNMARAIGDIGKEVTGSIPTILGVCEIENRKVLEDLIQQPPLQAYKLGIIHFDSPDRRGIDVALIYHKKLFVPSNYRRYALFLYDESGKREYTRDQLVVSGRLDGEELHFIINHWPSRRGGEVRSSEKRKKAARLNVHIADSLFQLNPYAKIISMGDFNDDPESESIAKILHPKTDPDPHGFREWYNPMFKLRKKGYGTLAYRDSWNLFDQFLLTSEFLKKDYSSYRFYKTGIFSPEYLIQQHGPYKGYPFRSFGSEGFTGGYSDHFPVYMYIIKAAKTD